MTAEQPRRALLLENIHAEGRAALEAAGWEVETAGSALRAPELVERLDGVQLLGIRSQTKITEEVLEAAPHLLAVGAYCIGTDQVDLPAATRRGTAVFNAPFGNTRSVVELAIGEVLALLRQLVPHHRDMHAGVWRERTSGSHELRRRVLGIVGYGNIGSQLSVVAEALGMDVVFYNTSEKLARGRARACSSLEALLEQSDVVTIHVDGRRGNAGSFGEEQFALMRQGALFLNLSRGFVVDHEALRRRLLSGHLAGAAVDVFPHEPEGNGLPFTSVLQGLDNVILTPHVAGSTLEAQEEIGRFVSGKLRDFASRGSTALSVNLPQLDEPLEQGRLRLAHLHRNEPGALAGVDRVLAAAEVNITRQRLATHGEVGYCLTDVEATSAIDTTALRDGLAELPGTLRTALIETG